MTGTVLLMAGVYAAAFFGLYAVAGTGAAALVVLPVLVIAYTRGGRDGIVAAAGIGLMVNPLLLYLQGLPVGESIVRMLPGVAVASVMAVLVGRLRTLSRRLQHELHERHAMEAMLRQSERVHRQLFEAAGDAILIFEPATETILEANQSAADLYGYSREELLGKSLKAFSSDVARGEEAVRQTLEAGKCREFEFVQFRRDGRSIHVLVSATVIEYGGQQAILSINRDVTERKQEEAALRESEMRFKSLLHSLKDGVWSTTLDGRHVFYQNRAVKEIYGATHSPENPSGWMDAIQEDDRARIEASLPELFETGYQEQEYRVVCPDETVRWHRNSVSLIYNEDGEPDRIGGVTTDITHRKQMEEALRESRDRYSSVIDTVKDIVFQTDAEGRWTFLNPAWEEVTGFTVEESLGQPFLDYVYPDDRQRNLALFRPLIERKKTHCRHEVRYLTRTGGYRWIEVYARLVIDDKDQIVGTSGTLHDVTERHEAMDVLEAALERERELGSLKSRFVSMASHELRTPLTTIRSSTELLQQFGDRWAADHRKTLFDRVLSSVDTMTDLIDDVLLLGRADTGRLPFAPQCLNLCDFCGDLVQEFEREAGSRHQIRLHVSGGPIAGEADPKLLRLMLGNLLANAVKYAPVDSPIDLRLASSENQIRIVVEDRGIGIPAADLEHLFEPFHRASNVEEHPGVGLGLAIAKRAVDLHGGTIRVASTEGVGTTFTVTLPLESMAAPVLPDEVEPRHPTASPRGA